MDSDSFSLLLDMIVLKTHFDGFHYESFTIES